MSEQNAPAAQANTEAAAQNQPAPAPAAAPEIKSEAAAEAGAAKPETGTEAKETSGEQKEEPKPLELKLPEGSKLDAKFLEKAKQIASAKGFSQDQAQAFVEEGHALLAEYEQNQQTILSNLNDKTWKEELLADAEIGGSPEALEQSGHLAARAAEKFFGAQFMESLKAQKLNHHPELFRGLVRIAKAMQDDKFVNTAPAAGDKSIADVFYGSNKE